MVEADMRKKITRFINKLVCGLVFYTGLYFILKLIFLKNGLYIFFYHNIVDTEKCKQTGESIALSSVDKKKFDRQLRYFKREYNVITMDEAFELLKKNAVLDKKYLVVTFDDGYKDNHIYGCALFQKHEIYPTIYLSANNVDNSTYLWPDILKHLVYQSKKANIAVDIYNIHYSSRFKTTGDRIRFLESINEDIKKLDEEKKYEVFEYLSSILDVDIQRKCDIMLNWGEVKSLTSIGVLIGAHTLNHPILATLVEEAAENEIYGSKRLIEEKTQMPIEHFAYPNGKPDDINQFCINRVRKYFKTAVTTIPGINRQGTDLMRLKRIGIAYDLNIVDLKIKVLYFCILDKLKRSEFT